MQNRQNNTMSLALGLLMVLASSVQGQSVVRPHSGDNASAKDIFYRLNDPEAEIQPTLALNYRILLKRGHDVTEVPSNHTFHSGDCFRLVFQANIDGYVYLLHKGSTGEGRFLFPDPRINDGRNHVSRYTEHVVPAQGWFHFDENTGAETIHVIVSAKPLPSFLRLLGHQEIETIRWQNVVDTFVFAYRRLAGQGCLKDIVYVDMGQDVTLANWTPTETIRDTSTSSEERTEIDPEEPDGQNASSESSESNENDAHAINQPESDIANAPASDQSSDSRPENSEDTCSGQDRPHTGQAANSPVNETVRTYVAHAEAPAGSQNLLLHTITLIHE